MLGRKGVAVRDLYESMGEAAFVSKMAELLESTDPKERLLPGDFSLRELHEAVDVTAFKTVTGLLVSKTMMDAYNAAPVVGPQLVTVFQSNQLIDRVPGAGVKSEMGKVNPGMPYGRTGDLEEKYAQIKGSKYGEIMDITEEAIMFDQTGLILRAAGEYGLKAAAYREKHILYTIQDQSGYEAYYPAGVQTALYSSGNANKITDPLVDHTDINSARVKLAAMTDANGDPILSLAKQILVPVALEMTAGQIFKSPVLIGGANAEPNPYQNMFAPISSPYLDAVSAADWYFGDFKRQFLWKEVIPLQVLSRTSESDDAWLKDIKTSLKIRYYGECGAVDYRFVIMSDN